MIYIITHKQIDIKCEDGYDALLVGAVNHPELKDLYKTDDTGDNISYKNNTYCELTGLYWIWKNTNDDVIGLVHYRRFFGDYVHYLFHIGWHYVFLNNKQVFYKLITKEKIDELLENNDVIVANDSIWSSLEENLSESVGKSGVSLLKYVIKTYYPEYLKTMSDYFSTKVLITKNMFIGKKNIMDEYCQWLFDVLKKIEECQIEINGKKFNNRELGYFSERLFGIWLIKNNIKYVSYRYILLEETGKPNNRMIVTVSDLPELTLRYIGKKMKIIKK